jgi:hypothetical protein
VFFELIVNYSRARKKFFLLFSLSIIQLEKSNIVLHSFCKPFCRTFLLYNTPRCARRAVKNASNKIVSYKTCIINYYFATRSYMKLERTPVPLSLLQCTFRQSDPFELENHFLSLTCRPKKLPTALPKYTAMKRKRDIFEPQPGCSTELDDFKPKFSFLNSLPDLEESFTFKFTSSECRGGSTTGHLFDFGGNKKDTFNFCFD